MPASGRPHGHGRLARAHGLPVLILLGFCGCGIRGTDHRSPRMLELGKATYLERCAACHGAKGTGDGTAAGLLSTRPRDLAAGKFRLVSTWNGIPTDQDLYRAISNGLPGTAMPAWSHLPDQTLWGLVHYVKSLSNLPPDSGRAAEIQVPPQPRYDAVARQRGQSLFLAGCSACHGVKGKGDGNVDQRDAGGFPIRPRDLTAGIYKGSNEPEQLYKRVIAGMPGSPMPQSPYLHGVDAWYVVHFLRSLNAR